MRPSLVPLLATLPLVACAPSQATPFARAYTMEAVAQGVGGPKAIAYPGDFVLENEHIRVAVVGNRYSMGPNTWGGSLVDADLNLGGRFAGGRGNDQLAEIIPSVSLAVAGVNESSSPDLAEDGLVWVVSDGSDGGPAVVRAAGPAKGLLTLLDALYGLLSVPDFEIVTDYVLEPGKPWLTMRTAAVVGWDGVSDLDTEGVDVDYYDADMPILELGLEDGLVIGDFYLQGGDIDVFAPGIGFDEDGAVYRKNEEGSNTFEEPFAFDFLAGVGDGVSYGLAAKQGKLFVPLFTASQTAGMGGGVVGSAEPPRFPAGSSYVYERYFFVGHGDVGSIEDQFLEARQLPYGTVSGTVVEEGTELPLSGVDVLVFPPGGEAPINQWRTDVSPIDDVADGSFGGRLPPGDYEAIVHHLGRPDSERRSFTVAEGGSVPLRLVSPRPGLVSFTVRDQDDLPIPAKVTFYKLDGEMDRSPLYGDELMSLSEDLGRAAAITYPLHGEGEVELPDGTYQAIATRGLEYELAVSEPFEVDAAHRHRLRFSLEKSVESAGWISADLHVHARPSFDAGIALADRARTMACEGVEFFSSSDHDHITDYRPIIEDLGLEPYVNTAVGLEVTTLELGHFIGFPLAPSHVAEANGAVDWTEREPGAIFEKLEKLGNDAGTDPFTFVAHPRDGILGYFDQYGFDEYAGVPGRGGDPGIPATTFSILSLTNPLLDRQNLYWDFDGLELLNGKRFDFVRTPTQPELDRFAADGSTTAYEVVTRTLREQQDLKDGVFRLGWGRHGQVDDWFTLLNLGFKYTALGNSDTHGWTAPEAGCPRNYVLVGSDEPGMVDGEAVADALRQHRAVASYGPLVQLWANGEPIGSEIEPDDGKVALLVDVQAPTWMRVDHVELYENGTLIREWELPDDPGQVTRLYETVELSPSKDSWYVAIAAGDDDLSPLFTTVEIPYVELQEVVTEALGGVEQVSDLLDPLVPIPRVHPVHPFAVTNPIWVDLDGDGFDAPGLPDWLQAPEPPP